MRAVAIGLTLAVGLTPAIAVATSCVSPWSVEAWWDEFASPAGGLPVDAELALYVPANTTTGGCSLIAEDHAVSLTVEDSGAGMGSLERLIRLIPGEQLLPARTYRLECEALVEYERGHSLVGEDRVIEVVTRAEAEPASPPGEVVVAGARHVRTDSSLCRCDEGEVIALSLGDLDEAYLREGGRIEATYPDGQVFPISAGTELADGEVRLPYTRGPIALTPVAANGVRGETVRVEAEEIDDQAVYIPCRSSLAGPSRALWWLLPVLWIGWRRRRPGARGAA